MIQPCLKKIMLGRISQVNLHNGYSRRMPVVNVVYTKDLKTSRLEALQKMSRSAANFKNEGIVKHPRTTVCVSIYGRLMRMMRKAAAGIIMRCNNLW